jgi:hypothetical protein
MTMGAARIVAVLVLLGVIFGAGYSLGTRLTQARWDAAELQARQQAAETRAEDQRLAGRAATAYETTRAAAAARQPEARHAIQTALQRASCPPATPLADVVVPAAVLDGLRLAGDGPAPDRPTAGGAGITVRRWPGLADR